MASQGARRDHVVTDMGASDGQHSYAIYIGNAQTGILSTTGTIPLPQGYQPLLQEEAIILGFGGDNSNSAEGYFFEGVNDNWTVNRPDDGSSPEQYRDRPIRW
jgi:hypothetical protein